MRVRTFLAVLFALIIVVTASYLAQQNPELLTSPFRLSAGRVMPVYLALLIAFLAGFLPAAGVLLVQTLKRDLAQRRTRRQQREARSLRGGFRRAVDLEIDGQWAKAATELETMLTEQPEDFSGLLLYGEVLRQSGRADEALEVHRRASVLYPQSVAVLYQLIDDYDAAGKSDVAHQIRDRVLRDYPGIGLRILRRRRNAAMTAKQWPEAVRLQDAIEALLREGGDETELEKEADIGRGLAYQGGVELVESERFEEARRAFRELVEREPAFLPARILAGETELLAGDSAAAEMEWRRGYEETGNPVFLQRIEDYFIRRAEPLGAIETLHDLIAISENDLLPRFFLGRLYYRLEMHDEALRALEPLRDRIKASPKFHYLLARIRERRGEMAKAVEAYLECVQQAGVPVAEYRCRSCAAARYPEWQSRCDSCGAWNSVEIDFTEESISLEELGVRQGPVWGGNDEEPS